MNDLISRAAVIDAVEDVNWYHQNKNGEMVQGANSAEHQAWYKAEDIYAAIEALPSAQRWIPCTPETMPQEDGEYLVTIHWESGGYYTDLFRYKAYLKEWQNEDRIFGTVIAWQPKPKPWEGEKP